MSARGDEKTDEAREVRPFEATIIVKAHSREEAHSVIDIARRAGYLDSIREVREVK